MKIQFLLVDWSYLRDPQHRGHESWCLDKAKDMVFENRGVQYEGYIVVKLCGGES